MNTRGGLPPSGPRFSFWGPTTMVFLRFLYVDVRNPKVFNGCMSTPMFFSLVFKGQKAVLNTGSFPALHYKFREAWRKPLSSTKQRSTGHWCFWWALFVHRPHVGVTYSQNAVVDQPLFWRGTLAIYRFSYSFLHICICVLYFSIFLLASRGWWSTGMFYSSRSDCTAFGLFNCHRPQNK